MTIWSNWGIPGYEGPTAGFLYARQTEILPYVFGMSPPTEAAGMIGTDFLERTGFEINIECGRMALPAVGEPHFANSDSQGKRVALTVFSEVQVGRSIRPTGQKKLHLHEEPSKIPRFETNTDCCRSWLIRTTEDITVAPRCRQIATGRLEIEKGESLTSLVCVEPALIPIQGVLPARVLTRVETVTPPSSKLTSQTGCVEIGQTINRAHVVVANFNDEPLTVPNSTVTGVAKQVSEKVVNLVNSGEDTVAKLPTMRKPTNVGISEPVSEAGVNLEMSGGQTGAKSPTIPRRKRGNLRPMWG